MQLLYKHSLVSAVPLPLLMPHLSTNRAEEEERKPRLAQSPNNHRLCKIRSLTLCLLSSHLWQQIVNLKVCKIRIGWVLATFSHLNKNKRTGLLLNYFGERNTQDKAEALQTSNTQTLFYADRKCQDFFLKWKRAPLLASSLLGQTRNRALICLCLSLPTKLMDLKIFQA